MDPQGNYNNADFLRDQNGVKRQREEGAPNKKSPAPPPKIKKVAIKSVKKEFQPSVANSVAKKKKTRGLTPYGYFTSNYGITKSDPERRAILQSRKDNKGDGLGKKRQLDGLVASAIDKGVPEAEARREIKGIGDYSRVVSKYRSKFQRGPNKKYLKGADGKRLRNPSAKPTGISTKASAYDISQLTGKRHAQKVARYLSILGPKSTLDFIAFDKKYYPVKVSAKGKRSNVTITEDELADFISYTINPWERANGAISNHWTTQIPTQKDVAFLQSALYNGFLPEEE